MVTMIEFIKKMKVGKKYVQTLEMARRFTIFLDDTVCISTRNL
jgi:hypothetical protein